MRLSRLLTFILLGAGIIMALSSGLSAAPLRTRNVFLCISDGLRSQEVFNGAEESLLTLENGGIQEPDELRAEFWRSTSEDRRAALLPFIWNTIAKQGQILGNQEKGSSVKVTNGKNFSYPGYNEMLTGFGDPRVDSNDKKPNPNITVFEWLNYRPEFKGRVAVLGTWDLFPYIFNCERSQLPIWPAWEKRFTEQDMGLSPLLTELIADTTPFAESVTYDSFLFHAVRETLATRRPRLLFVGFGETDEWAHAGRYDQYLTAAHHVDRFIGRLWTEIQTIPEYRERTTFIITADHGRGSGTSEWKSHGENVAGSEADWIAVLGPDTAPLGERSEVEPATLSQVAATIAALLGEDFAAEFPNAAPPLAEVFRAAASAAIR